MTARKSDEHEGKVEVEVRYSPSGETQGSTKWLDKDEAAQLVREGRVVPAGTKAAETPGE